MKITEMIITGREDGTHEVRTASKILYHKDFR